MEEIAKLISTDFDEGGFKLSNTHYENGKSLHSNHYYFVKKFFQNNENCKKVSEQLVTKIKNLQLSNSVTFVGFRNYIGLVLSEALNQFDNCDYNFELIDKNDEGYLWKNKPQLKQNIVIVLPIASTCSSYFRIKKFIDSYIDKKQIIINKQFITLFLILDKSIESKSEIKIDKSNNKDENLKKIYDLYHPFNWDKITSDSIFFYKSNVVGHAVVRLYSDIFLPESCPLCFPDKKKGQTEKPIFTTHDTFETPSLIFDFPNFKKVKNQHSFIDLFASTEIDDNIHLYGNVTVNSSNFINYIRGNAFYKRNRPKILSFFEKKLKEHINVGDNILFITSEIKNSSEFIEDLIKTNLFAQTKVNILRFQPSNEFIDNFLSLYKDLLNVSNTKLIYFEEVLTAGNAFKLISDNIKHIKKGKTNNIDVHGVDLLLTLIDRTTSNTKDEILNKIKSNINENYEEHFITFYTLNAPIIFANHLGNPLNKRLEHLEKLKEYTLLDSIKHIINKQIENQKPKSLPEISPLESSSKELDFFPFASIEVIGNQENLDQKSKIIDLYKPFNKEKMDLLKLYLAHEINCLLTQEVFQSSNYFIENKESPESLIELIIEIVKENTKNEIYRFFVEEKDINSKIRNFDVEEEIVVETIIKILSRPPFVYYKYIYDGIFNYCIKKLDDFLNETKSEGIKTFHTFRKFKFYIRRSIDLNSNFIISEKFLKRTKNQFDGTKIKSIIKIHKQNRKRLNQLFILKKINEEYYLKCIKNIDYKINQITSYFPYLLFCYKDLVFKNPYVSIRLEELINSQELLPLDMKDNDMDIKEPDALMSDLYFQFTGMIKAENTFLLNDLKKYHKENPKIKSIPIPTDLKHNYFIQKKNDPILVNVNKLIQKSRFNQEGLEDIEKFNDIKTAVSYMLKTTDLINKSRTYKLPKEQNLNLEIKKVLDSILDIIDNKKENKLNYAFFIEYKKRQQDDNGRVIQDKSDNIYSILSNEDVTSSQIVTLRKDGLIYNLMYGLYDSKNETKNVQTLISSALLKNNKIIAYKKNYYYPVDKKIEIEIETEKGIEIVERYSTKYKKESFKSLYENDLYDDETETGLELLNNSNMAIFIRLTDFSKKTETNQEISGEAVLVLSCEKESTITNFLEFKSNEKLRLILLLKDELLKYLQKQFDNDAFIDTLASKKTDDFRTSLRHGLTGYNNSVLNIIQGFKNNLSSKFNKDFDLLNIVMNAINGQLMIINKQGSIKTYSRFEIENKIKLIFSSDIFRYKVDLKRVKIDIDCKKIELNSIIMDVVIPELIINMKKYCPRCSSDFFVISYNKESQTFLFSNPKHLNIDTIKMNKGHKGGIWMIKNIFKKYDLGKVKINSKLHDRHIVELKLIRNESN